MLNQIENWIDQTLNDFSNRTVPCDQLLTQFAGYYPSDFLSKSYFVVIDEIPMPDFPELREAGLGGFLDMKMDGVTYKNTYFIKTVHQNNFELHFHELVHVLQWQYLGAQRFISRYIEEMQKYGYRDAPLEKMAYDLGDHFSKNGEPLDIPSYVQQKIGD